MLARLTLLAFAASLSLPATALAQARIGVMGGVNFATIGGDDADENFSSRTGPIFGVSFFKPLSGALGLEVDGLYSVRGFKASDEGVSGGFKFTYIEVPLLLRYSLSESSSTKPHLGGGVSLGFQTGCKIEVDGSGVSGEVSCSLFEDESEAEFEKFDAHLVLGGGVDFVRGKNTISLGARYNYGLTDLSANSSIRNRGFSIFAGFSIPVGK